MKDGLVKKILHLKNDYKDGIPVEIKHSTSEDSGWKVQQGVWFQNVASLISEYLINFVIEDDVRRGNEIFEYWKRLTSPHNSMKGNLTKQSDIDEAEAILDKILKELQG